MWWLNVIQGPRLDSGPENLFCFATKDAGGTTGKIWRMSVN